MNNRLKRWVLRLSLDKVAPQSKSHLFKKKIQLFTTSKKGFVTFSWASFMWNKTKKLLKPINRSIMLYIMLSLSREVQIEPLRKVQMINFGFCILGAKALLQKRKVKTKRCRLNRKKTRNSYQLTKRMLHLEHLTKTS